MSQAIEIGTIEKIGLSLKNKENKVAASETTEVKEIKVSEAKISVNDRFARLKRSLRKRSASIL